MLKASSQRSSKAGSLQSLISEEPIDEGGTYGSQMANNGQSTDIDSLPLSLVDEKNMDKENSQTSLLIRGPDSEYESSDDLITPEKEDTLEVKKRKFYKYMLVGYVMICLALLFNTMLFLAGKLTVQQISLFETGIFKCVIQLITASSTVLLLRLPWRINWQHFHFAFLAGICEYVGNACYYTASGLLPIGDLQAIFSILVIMLAAVVDTTAGRINFSSIISGVVSSLGVLLLVQPWEPNIDLLKSAPCEIMSMYDIVLNMTGANFSTDDPTSAYNVHRVVSIVGLNVDAEVTGYLLVFFGAIAITAFYNFIQLLGQLYPVPTAILWVGATESCLSVLLAIVVNHWKQPKEQWCVIFIICYVIMKVALTFTLYFAFYFLKISHVITTLSLAFVLLSLFQNSFLSVFYDPPGDVMEVAGTLFVAVGVMLAPCLLIMSKHNPYRIPEFCDPEEDNDD